jgi:hypothetical protein
MEKKEPTLTRDFTRPVYRPNTKIDESNMAEATAFDHDIILEEDEEETNGNNC